MMMTNGIGAVLGSLDRRATSSTRSSPRRAARRTGTASGPRSRCTRWRWRCCSCRCSAIATTPDAVRVPVHGGSRRRQSLSMAERRSPWSAVIQRRPRVDAATSCPQPGRDPLGRVHERSRRQGLQPGGGGGALGRGDALRLRARRRRGRPATRARSRSPTASTCATHASDAAHRHGGHLRRCGRAATASWSAPARTATVGAAPSSPRRPRCWRRARVVLAQLETPVAAGRRAASRCGRARRRADDVLNPAPANARRATPSLLAQADVLTPNETEFARAGSHAPAASARRRRDRRRRGRRRLHALCRRPAARPAPWS